MLPGHTLASVHNRPDGTKKAKDRVTINACANASGTIKLPLLLIGKAKNPRCFRNLNKEAVVYRNQANSWVFVRFFVLFRPKANPAIIINKACPTLQD